MTGYEVLENQNLCYICDSDAAIYFTGTLEQCSQYLHEQAEIFSFLPRVMILTEEKYVGMFSPTEITDPKAEILSGMAQMAKDEIRSVAETADLSQIIIIDPESL